MVTRPCRSHQLYGLESKRTSKLLQRGGLFAANKSKSETITLTQAAERSNVTITQTIDPASFDIPTMLRRVTTHTRALMHYGAYMVSCLVLPRYTVLFSSPCPSHGHYYLPIRTTPLTVRPLPPTPHQSASVSLVGYALHKRCRRVSPVHNVPIATLCMLPCLDVPSPPAALSAALLRLTALLLQS
jgi:hypothetical protein